ncbi:uncharacterized protein RCC_05305 [Ramularia collo-cygni]|uniref:Uncharacterized protein n=1 Tax=Ramularia collo-cygni TaxID=112498 RepID=A0A2D3V9Z5_9PEZI|nr:uncharacterized protein RCC_05305 [Ramularia collo-cygni]CZT19454.1 uncharacterized protein RCC_05305 [Ramularia collo-cygni]
MEARTRLRPKRQNLCSAPVELMEEWWALRLMRRTRLIIVRRSSRPRGMSPVGSWSRL